MSIHAHPTLKLGRPHGPSTRHALKLATFVDKTRLQAPPLALDLGHPGRIGQYGNDHLGDCTCATWAGVFLHDAAAQGETIDFTEAEIVKMYESSGYRPGDAASDHGWSLEAAANYAHATGLHDTAGTLHKVGPWMQINHADLTEVQIALFMLGALPVGVELPLAAQDLSRPWDTDGTDGPNGSQIPNSWGGHSLTLIQFDHDGVVFRTWGRRQSATWRWWLRYVDEVIGKIDPLWCSKDRPAPDGFLIDDLIAAQGAFR